MPLPPERIVALSAEDAEKFRTLYSTARRTSDRYDPRKIDHEEQPTPEMHLFYVPSGGIPPRTDYTPSGTGTAEIRGDLPGSALCTVWRLTQIGSVEALVPTEITYKLYNPFDVPVSGLGFVLGWRDKFGTWWADERILTDTRTGTGGDTTSRLPCEGCGWLIDVQQAACMRMTVLSGKGRCTCIDQGQVLYFVYRTTPEGAWVSTSNFKACCGCGRLELKIFPATMTATLTEVWINEGCSGSPETAFTYELRMECCTDGAVVFVGGGGENCEGAADTCVNLFRVKVECWPCPSGSCGCPGCRTKGLPPAFTISETGFTGDYIRYNGSWSLTRVEDVPGTSDVCAYSASCEDITITLDYDSSTEEWVLTFSGAGTLEYRCAVLNFDCCGSSNFSHVSGSGGGTYPDPISTLALSANGECKECCGGCDINELKQKTLYLTVSAPGHQLDGQVVAFTWDEAMQRFDTGSYPFGSCLCPVLGEARNLLFCEGGRFRLDCYASYCGIIADSTFLAASCEPFYAEGTGQITNDCAADLTPCTWVISETPP